jgi:hypothetical protein
MDAQHAIPAVQEWQTHFPDLTEKGGKHQPRATSCPSLAGTDVYAEAGHEAITRTHTWYWRMW